MPEIEDTAFKISAAFEDHYFEIEKRNAFSSVFNKYLSIADPEGTMEPYEAVLELGYRHRDVFDEMLRRLKELSLIE